MEDWVQTADVLPAVNRRVKVKDSAGKEYISHITSRDEWVYEGYEYHRDVFPRWKYISSTNKK